MGILLLARGNMGALNFLLQVDAVEDKSKSDIINKVVRCGIKGTDLYVLYSGICNRDLTTVWLLCNECPDDILKDACSRRDNSGRALIEKYLKQ